MKLGTGRLRYPHRITHRSLPRVYRGILQIEAAHAKQADSAISAMQGFAIVAGLDGLRPTLRSIGPRATSSATSRPSSLPRAQARIRSGNAKPSSQGTASSNSAGKAATGGTAAARGSGQLHHAISRKIYRELQKHANLRGRYKVRDPRFATRGVDKAAHRGYQRWHRDLDREIRDWIRRYKDATPAQFEAYLRKVYNRPELRARFPDGL